MNRKKYFFFSFLSAVSKTILLAALIVGLTSCESVFGSLSIPNSANCSVCQFWSSIVQDGALNAAAQLIGCENHP